MKNSIKTVLFIFLVFASVNSFAQTKEYAEIIVLQKVAKNESPLKEVYVNATSSDGIINSEEISEITSTPKLLKYMDTNGWIYVERLGSQPSNSGPLWISFLFKKE